MRIGAPFIRLFQLNFVFLLDCHYNREDDDGADIPQGEEDGEADRASEASLSSRRSSVVDDAPVDVEFEQEINRLIAAKQKVRQLQNLVAMVQVCFLSYRTLYASIATSTDTI